MVEILSAQAARERSEEASGLNETRRKVSAAILAAANIGEREIYYDTSAIRLIYRELERLGYTIAQAGPGQSVVMW